MADDTVVTASTGEDTTFTTGETDVKEEEQTTAEETATTASGGDETTSEDSSDEEEVAEGQKVPYYRWKEDHDARLAADARLRDMEAKIASLEGKNQPAMQNLSPVQQAQIQAAKEQLKALGFVTVEDQQKILKEREEDLELKQEILSLQMKFDGSDGRPKFDKDKVLAFALERKVGDLESAYKLLNEKKLTDWHIRQVAGKARGIKTETSTGTGQTTAGTTDQDLVKAAGSGDKDALHTFLKRRAMFAQGK